MLPSDVSRTTGNAAAFADDERWAAIAARDRKADGAFVFAVVTTGVYCRPSCPSRPALPKNVRFFGSPDSAEAAGFRPCKRCKPNDLTGGLGHVAQIEAACRRIELAIETGDPVPGLDELAAGAKLSRFHFHRVFKETTGVTPRAYAAARKAKLMRSELRDAARVTDAIYGAGYGSASRFYESAQARLGMAASAWRDGGRGATIRFAVGECSLGAILVAATEHGVCHIAFGDDPQVLVDAMQQRFAKASFVGGDSGFESVVAAVVAHVERPERPLGLSLDVRGTAFQEQVWRVLRQIPAGSTATYADVAARIGRPKAVRAVASACAANPVAVAIPCHRVIRIDGGHGGYRWGIERKRALLEREAS